MICFTHGYPPLSNVTLTASSSSSRTTVTHPYVPSPYMFLVHTGPPQWGAANAEMQVPSDENTGLKCSPFKAWSRSEYSHTCYACCQGFLPCLFLPFRSIHLHFSKTSPDFIPVLAMAKTSSCVGPQNKIRHPAGCRFPCWLPAEYK